MPHEHELSLEDVDLFRVLGLPGHLFEVTAAARTDVIGFIENVNGSVSASSGCTGELLRAKTSHEMSDS